MDTVTQWGSAASTRQGERTREPLQAVIYCRISLAVMDDRTKVEDQERQCRELCARRGWHIARIYVDNSRSAWQRDRKRPGWDQMLADIVPLRIGAVVTYWGDRLVRQPRDLEDLLDLREVRQITLASIAGQYDFANPDHRMMMRWEVARACNESDNISRRKKAGFARMALKGEAPVPGGQGGRAFGYEHDGRTPHPVEAEAVRQAARRILAGETLAAICRDLAAAGITSTTGRPLTYGTLKRVLLNPRVAGLLRDGTAGSWEPLIGPGTQQMIASTFATAPSQSATVRYLLSGIARCFCGKPVQSIPHRRGLSYGCVTEGCKKVRRNMAHLDTYVTARLLVLLGSAEVAVALPETGEDTALAVEIAGLVKRRQEALDVLDSLIDHPGATAAALSRSVDQFSQRIALLRAQSGGPERRLLATHAGITAQEFRSLPITMRRSLVAAAYNITIKPASRRGSPGFYPEDVDVRRREP